VAINTRLIEWATTQAHNARKDAWARRARLQNYDGRDRSRLTVLEIELKEAEIAAGYAEHDAILWSTVVADRPLTPIE
jgi:hypothetical protein